MKEFVKWILMVCSGVLGGLVAFFLQARYSESPTSAKKDLEEQKKKVEEAEKKIDEKIKQTDKVKEDNDEKIKKPVSSITDVDGAIEYARDVVSEYRRGMGERKE